MIPTHASIKRNHAEWQPDLQVTLAEDGSFTASHSFYCHSSDALQLLPKKGSACVEEGYESLFFNSGQISRESGMIAKVDCEYIGTINNEWDFSGDELPDAIWQLRRSTVEEPIELCPRYKDKIDKELIKEVRDGTIQVWLGDKTTITNGIPEVVFYTRQDTVKSKTKPEDDEGVTVTVYEVGDGWDETLTTRCAYFIVTGEDSYLAPRMSWTGTFSSKRSWQPSDYGSLGEIDIPKGNPPTPSSGNYNWLFSGVSQTEQSGIYQIVVEWILSSEDGWNEDFYDYYSG